MNDLWVGKLKKLQEKERQAAVAFAGDVARAQERYDKMRQDLDEERHRLDLTRNDPIVIVRRSFGPRPTKYHLARCECNAAYRETMAMDISRFATAKVLTTTFHETQ